MEVVTELSQIDQTTKEGRLLIAAVIKVAGVTKNTTSEILEELEKIATNRKLRYDGFNQ